LLNHYALKVVLITSKVLQELECLSRAHGFRQELSLAHLFEQFSKLGTAAGVAHFPLFENRGGDFLIGVLFSPALRMLGLIRVDYEIVKELANKNRGRYSFRLNQPALNDPRVEKLFWNEAGLEI